MRDLRKVPQLCRDQRNYVSEIFAVRFFFSPKDEPSESRKTQCPGRRWRMSMDIVQGSLDFVQNIHGHNY